MLAPTNAVAPGARRQNSRAARGASVFTLASFAVGAIAGGLAQAQVGYAGLLAPIAALLALCRLAVQSFALPHNLKNLGAGIGDQPTIVT
jgi:uncharacterized membrane protein YoaK (UPF0700 family)